MAFITNAHLTSWAAELVTIFDQDSSDLRLRALAKWLKEISGSDFIVVFLYRGKARPICLFDTFSPSKHRVFVEEYQTGPYLLDPLYIACAARSVCGLQRMRRLAPDHFFRSEYFRTFYRRLNLSEEIAYFCPIRDDAYAVFSLMRSEESTPFPASEFSMLECAFPVVQSILKSLSEALILAQPDVPSDVPTDMEDFLSSFGSNILTQREREVLKLLLRGHSNKSTAQSLLISAETVKIHKKRIYSKLSVRNQAELFAVFIKAISIAS